MTKGRPVETFPVLSEEIDKAWHIKVIKINDDFTGINEFKEDYLVTLDLDSLKLIFKQQSNRIKVIKNYD